jgi:hypothetical protein
MDGAATATWPRRTFLAVGLGAAGALVLSSSPAGALAGGSAPAGRPATLKAAPTGLRRREWSGLVGRTVTVAGAGGRARMAVVDVSDIAGAPAGHDGCFQVTLRAQDRVAVASGVSQVGRPGAAPVSLFVSPIDRGVRARHFQIVVNNPS